MFHIWYMGLLIPYFSSGMRWSFSRPSFDIELFCCPLTGSAIHSPRKHHKERVDCHHGKFSACDIQRKKTKNMKPIKKKRVSSSIPNRTRKNSTSWDLKALDKLFFPPSFLVAAKDVHTEEDRKLPKIPVCKFLLQISTYISSKKNYRSQLVCHIHGELPQPPTPPTNVGLHGTDVPWKQHSFSLGSPATKKKRPDTFHGILLV